METGVIALCRRSRDFHRGEPLPLAHLLAVHILAADAPDARADRLATYAFETEVALDRTSFAELTSGQISYPQMID